MLNAIRYDGYGVTIDAFAAGSGAIATPWRFQGRLDVSPDADTPLYDLSARHYSPGLGTFTQFDSMRGQIAEPLSMNRYLYAHASPSTLTDPTGHAVYMKDGVTANRPAYQALKYQTTLAYVRKQTPSATAVLARLGFGAVRKGGAEVYSPIDGSKSARTAGQAALGTGGAAADILGKNVVKQSVEMMAEWSRAADLVRPIPVVGGWYATLIESGGRGISGAGSALGKVVSVGGKAAGLAGAAWSGVDAAEARLVLERQLNSEASVEIQTVRAGMVGAATTAGGWAGGVVGGLGCAATGYGVWATAGCAGAGGIAGGIAGEWLGNVALDAVDATARVLENLPWGTP